MYDTGRSRTPRKENIGPHLKILYVYLRPPRSHQVNEIRYKVTMNEKKTIHENCFTQNIGLNRL